MVKLLLVNYSTDEDKVIQYLKKRLSKIFSFEVVIAKNNVPECRKRGLQLNAEDFLPDINVQVVNGKADYGLGVTVKDLYVPGLNFVFGLAYKNSAVISLVRLKSENKEQYFGRALKEAVHEIGHLMGLLHCPNAKCVMHFSNCLGDTDYKKEDLCGECKKMF